MGFVRRWFTVLMTRLTPYMYGNGGPIIMVQVSVLLFCRRRLSPAALITQRPKLNAGGKWVRQLPRLRHSLFERAEWHPQMACWQIGRFVLNRWQFGLLPQMRQSGRSLRHGGFRNRCARRFQLCSASFAHCASFISWISFGFRHHHNIGYAHLPPLPFILFSYYDTKWHKIHKRWPLKQEILTHKNIHCIELWNSFVAWRLWHQSINALVWIVN